MMLIIQMIFCLLSSLYMILYGQTLIEYEPASFPFRDFPEKGKLGSLLNLRLILLLSVEGSF